MPIFEYTATSDQGQRLTGRIESASQDAASAELAGRGLQHVSLHPLAVVPCETAAATSATPSESSFATDGRPLTITEQSELVAQLGMVVRSGVPLSVAFRSLAEELPSTTMQNVLRGMASDLEGGDLLEVVMDRHAAHFAPWLRAMVKAGAASGHLDRCLTHYVQFSRQSNVLRGVICSALLYPLVLAAAGSILISAVLVNLVDPFHEIFDEFGTELPSMTRLMLQLSDWVRPLAVVMPLLLCVSFFAAIRVASGRLVFPLPRFVWRFLHMVPVVGSMLRQLSMSECCHLLSMLVSSRMPLPQAFSVAGHALRDPIMGRRLVEASFLLEDGVAVTDLHRRVRRFPITLTRAGHWNNPEALADSLAFAAQLPAIQAEVTGRALTGIATPLTALVIGAVIIFTLTALLIPLFSLLQALA